MEYLQPAELLKVLGVAKKRSKRDHCMFLLAYGHALRALEEKAEWEAAMKKLGVKNMRVN